MDRRERDRYDRDNYNRDYSGGAGYGRGDEHYHSARNLTNEFEQEYQSHHPDMDRDRDRYMRDRDRGGMRQSYHEGDSGGAYEQRRREEDRDFRGRDYGFQQRDRDRDRDFTDSYSSRNRYSQRSDDFGDRDRDRYSDRDSYGSRERRGGMSHDRMREGYGISDYGRTGQSSVRSNRGIPNAGVSSSFSDDYGSTDFDRDRSYGISSGNYGAYGSHRGGFSRNRDDW
ncbi:hypothetical protein [uncultured Pontibacter sp.]|uniref:hypothetical protein n=1 Tax=uncultured Pontibacter sp. TaxID=453356 RepID=UPI00260840BC|nr:hypothetical protein [uncultured Pontibacter sp.]